MSAMYRVLGGDVEDMDADAVKEKETAEFLELATGKKAR